MAVGDIRVGSSKGAKVTAATGCAADQYVVEGENGSTLGPFASFDEAKAVSENLIEAEDRAYIAAQAAFLASRSRGL